MGAGRLAGCGELPKPQASLATKQRTSYDVSRLSSPAESHAGQESKGVLAFCELLRKKNGGLKKIGENVFVMGPNKDITSYLKREFTTLPVRV